MPVRILLRALKDCTRDKESTVPPTNFVILSVPHRSNFTVGIVSRTEKQSVIISAYKIRKIQKGMEATIALTYANAITTANPATEL